MQNTYFFILSFFLVLHTTASYSQQKRDTAIVKKMLSSADLQQRQHRYEKKADSVIADRELTRMREIIDLTPEQEQELSQVIVTTNARRREVFRGYWKKEGFREQMTKVDQDAEILYRSIVGEKGYRIYQDTLQNRLQQRRQLMESQGKFEDTTTIKLKANEKQ